MWGTCQCIPCCSALEFHTPPQRYELFHWKLQWLFACSEGPGWRKEANCYFLGLFYRVCKFKTDIRYHSKVKYFLKIVLLPNKNAKFLIRRCQWLGCCYTWEVWLNSSNRRSYSLLFSLNWSWNILSCSPTASMSTSITTCCCTNKNVKDIYDQHSLIHHDICILCTVWKCCSLKYVCEVILFVSLLIVFC